MFFFFKQKTAYEMRISDWSSDVCSSDLLGLPIRAQCGHGIPPAHQLFGQHRCRNRFGCFFFELSQRRCDQDTDVTVAQDQDLALIQPAPSEYEQLIPIGAAGHLIAQGAYQGATLVLRHPMKPQDNTGQLLMHHMGLLRFGCFFVELSRGRCDQDSEVTVAQYQDLALIQPAPSEYEQWIPIGAAGHLIAQGAYQGATLVLRHPMKPQDITGQLLMVKEGATANIQGSQGCQFNSSDADFVTQLAPQGCRNDAHRIQQAPAQEIGRAHVRTPVTNSPLV